jgi:hypothetical protein
MSDLAPFVAAALRDKVLLDMMEEQQTLREEKESLACRIGNLMHVTVRSASGRDLETRSPDRTSVESDPRPPRIESIQDLLAAQVWLGRPRLLFLNSLGRLSVDSVLYTRVGPPPTASVEGHDREQVPGIEQGPLAAHPNRATRIRIDTRWVAIHVVVGTSNGHHDVLLLDPDSVQMIMLGSGQETVADVLRVLREADNYRSAATPVVHQIEIHSLPVSRAFIS